MLVTRHGVMKRHREYNIHAEVKMALFLMKIAMSHLISCTEESAIFSPRLILASEAVEFHIRIHYNSAGVTPL